MSAPYSIGIDIGSVSVDVAVLDADRKIVSTSYRRTDGQPLHTALAVLEELDKTYPLSDLTVLAVTGSGGPAVAPHIQAVYVNELIALSRSFAVYHPEIRTVIEMGGEDSKLLLLDLDPVTGTVQLADFAMNTVCAAGTGSFLDQQASRLGVAIEEEFGNLALRSENPPRIAGRCSVFAKSDMIHLQQIATPLHDIVAGLCHAVARNFVSSIGKGKTFTRPIAFTGGVASNSGMVSAFASVLHLKKNQLTVPPHHLYMGALGCVLAALDTGAADEPEKRSTAVLARWLETREGAEHWHPALTHSYTPHTLVTGSAPPAGSGKTGAYLGIDVGSLSTNVVVIDKQGTVLARRYLRTAGRPIEAVRTGLDEVGAEVADKVDILGTGVTGSGRYMIGDFTGADIVRNEITAQATAAVHFDPEVDTIFEIGGQDSKYVSLTGGTVVDFEMNKVCAAGTGSFLEEQAEKLGVKIDTEFAELALRAEKPDRLGERCTVFIESDLVSCEEKGSSKPDLLAGLAYSIVYNYLNKVVAGRKVGNRIFFQGGVAYNQAVVAAFQEVTGKIVTVPPHHDVTGAIGAALLAARNRTWKTSAFKGWELSHKKYTVETFDCKGCANVCTISKVLVEGEKPLFYGSRCEKYEIGAAAKTGSLPDLFDLRRKLVFGALDKAAPVPGAKTVGIPRALHTYELFPYWHAFFTALGFNVVLSEPTNRTTISRSLERITAETCFPVKVMHGHILQLAEQKVDYLFLPSIINLKRDEQELENTYLCPYVQAIPYIIKGALPEVFGQTEVLTPAIHFGWDEKQYTRELIKFGKSLGADGKTVRAAIGAASAAQENLYRQFRKIGKAVLESVKDRALVILSRPYNGSDPALNLGLPRKLADRGVVVIPHDFLPAGDIDISGTFPNMYWKYGANLLRAAEYVKQHPKLFAVYITNFACGPDSFISHYVQDRMQGKPYLQIEVDEHAADAGLITRCEAFLDSLEGAGKRAAAAASLVEPDPAGDEPIDPDRTVYIPAMSDQSHAVAAVLRSQGTDARVLPETDADALKLGRAHASGRECFPFIVTAGDLLKKVTSKGFVAAKSAFLMPAANGPCRFGQYHKMHRVMLKTLGYDDVKIVSPSSKYSYTNILSTKARNRVWLGMLAVELTEKLARETRPYETVPGTTNRVYAEAIDSLVKVLENPRGRLAEALYGIKVMFRRVPVSRKKRKPVIGVVGEIYLRSNRFSNDNLVEKLEKLGAEVWVAPVTEWMFYINCRYKEDAITYHNLKGYVKMFLQDKFQRFQEHGMGRRFKGMLRNWPETGTETLLEHAEEFMDRSFGGEAILSIGKAIDYMEHGAAGIINVMPFTCMYGTVVTAMSRQLRERCYNAPWLNAAYDGQEDTGMQTRLEAFMHQAKAYDESRRPKTESR